MLTLPVINLPAINDQGGKSGHRVRLVGGLGTRGDNVTKSDARALPGQSQAVFAGERTRVGRRVFHKRPLMRKSVFEVPD